MAKFSIQLKVFGKPNYRTNNLRRSIRAAVEEGAKFTIPLFNISVATWEHKPAFGFSIYYKTNQIIGRIAPIKDNQVPHLSGGMATVYRFLNEGTSHRWAVMSSDWRSKTTPNVWIPGQGAGRVLVRGQRAMTSRNIMARPGIKARNWNKLIADRTHKQFMRILNRHISIFLRTQRYLARP